MEKQFAVVEYAEQNIHEVFHGKYEDCYNYVISTLQEQREAPMLERDRYGNLSPLNYSIVNVINFQ